MVTVYNFRVDLIVFFILFSRCQGMGGFMWCVSVAVFHVAS